MKENAGMVGTMQLKVAFQLKELTRFAALRVSSVFHPWL